MTSNADVLAVLFSAMPESERAVLCTVGGDPNTVERWPGIAWRLGSKCPLHPDANNYCAVGGFTANERGEYRRRKDQFAGLYLVMVDDLGTKLDPRSMPANFPPTMVVETSPKNYQAVFKLREPVRDYADADALIRGLTRSLVGEGPDPGMLGVTRVFRLPEGINGKPKYQNNSEPWRCRLVHWSPDTVYTAQELAGAFHAVLTYKSFVEPDTDVSIERKRGYSVVMDCLRVLGRIKGRQRAWTDVLCPWLDEHTDRGTTGTAITAPDKANGWYGGFKCHHGHCQGRAWGDLEVWVAEAMIEHGRQTRGPFTGA